MGIVYKITNKINNKCYIGITKHSFRKRYNHKDDWWNAPSVNPLLKNAVNKYGSVNFEVSIVEEVKKEELEKREIFYIKHFNSMSPGGYNLTSGGNYKYEVSLETKIKMKKAQKRIVESGKVIWNKNKKLSKTHINNIKKTKKENFKSGKVVAWNKNKKTGPMSEQAKINSGNAHKKPIICKDKDLNIIKKYDGAIDAKKNGFNPSGITLCCKGKIKTHRGLFWEYA